MKKLSFLLLISIISPQIHAMENKIFRPDSIKDTDSSRSGAWQVIKDEPISSEKNENKKFQELGMRIRKIHEFVPSNATNLNHKDVIVATHGTWGLISTQYFKEDNYEEKEKQNYRDIKRFATWYAYTHKKPVQLLSFIWSGALSDEERLKAADYLKAYLEAAYKNNANNNNLDTTISFISHSHGCNIINNLSHKLNLPINMIIHLACPMRKDEEKYQPKNFKQLIYFHSSGDRIEPLGRIPEFNLKLATIPYLVLPFALISGIALYEFKTHRDNINSLNISDFVKFPELAAKINVEKNMDILSFALDWYKHFCRIKASDVAKLTGLIYGPAYTTLGLGFGLSSLYHPENHFLAQDNAIVVGLKTKINQKEPGHSDALKTGHPEIADTLQLLPEILTKLYREYPAHVAHSFTADLSIDGNEKGEYLSEEPIKISNLKLHKKSHILPKSIPFVGLKTSHIKNQKDLDNVQRKKDFESFSLNAWYDEQSNSKNDILVKTDDDYGCDIELLQIHNDFDAQDLEAERNKDILFIRIDSDEKNHAQDPNNNADYDQNNNNVAQDLNNIEIVEILNDLNEDKYDLD